MSVGDHGLESFVPFFVDSAESEMFQDQLSYQQVKIAEVLEVTAVKESPNPFVTNVVTSVLMDLLPHFAKVAPVAPLAVAAAMNSAFAHRFGPSLQAALGLLAHSGECGAAAQAHNNNVATSAGASSGGGGGGGGVALGSSNAKLTLGGGKGRGRSKGKGNKGSQRSLSPLRLPVPDLATPASERLLASQHHRLTLIPSLPVPSGASAHALRQRRAPSQTTVPVDGDVEDKMGGSSDGAPHAPLPTPSPPPAPVTQGHDKQQPQPQPQLQQQQPPPPPPPPLQQQQQQQPKHRVTVRLTTTDRPYALSKEERKQWKQLRQRRAGGSGKHLGAAVAACIRQASTLPSDANTSTMAPVGGLATDGTMTTTPTARKTHRRLHSTDSLAGYANNVATVSYTHLTLPTIYSV